MGSKGLVSREAVVRVRGAPSAPAAVSEATWRAFGSEFDWRFPQWHGCLLIRAEIVPEWECRLGRLVRRHGIAIMNGYCAVVPRPAMCPARGEGIVRTGSVRAFPGKAELPGRDFPPRRNPPLSGPYRMQRAGLAGRPSRETRPGPCHARPALAQECPATDSLWVDAFSLAVEQRNLVARKGKA